MKLTALSSLHAGGIQSAFHGAVGQLCKQGAAPTQEKAEEADARVFSSLPGVGLRLDELSDC